MKPTRSQTVTFRESDVELFTRLSHDRNPLHVDPQYARRTPFGQCVVYGILGALAAMREPLRGAPLRLRRFSVQFKRPLYIDVPYTVTTEILSHGQLALSLGRGGVEKLALKLEYDVGGAPWTADPSTVGHASRREPADRTAPDLSTLEVEGDYALATALLPELKKQFAFQYSFIPLSQLTALIWSSYLVGMEVPGRQALFLSCSMEFAGPGRPDENGLHYRGSVTRHDAETSSLTLAAELSSSSGAVATVQLEAARRPLPIEFRLAPLEEKIGRSRTLEGKVALVTGSSRGLGSLLAMGCALHGANVVLNCREGREEADRTAAQIASLDRRAVVVQGDIQERDTWLRMLEACSSVGQGLDLFVNNAFPSVTPMAFAEVSDADLERYLRVVRTTAVGVQVLLPELARRKGTLVNISSEWTQTPPREFSHYVVAKCALEGLVLSLSKEYGAVRFVTVRPPRLLTDMTNGVVGAFQGRPPEGIVGEILRVMAQPANGENYLVVERFD